MENKNYDVILTQENNKVFIETFNNFKLCSIKLHFQNVINYKPVDQYMNESVIYNMDNMWQAVENQNTIFLFGTINKAVSCEGKRLPFFVFSEGNKLLSVSDISNEVPVQINESRIKIVNISEENTIIDNEIAA